ncbi:MAG: pantoate--beta-alanine ligase [Spirochaetia bacterium]|nr:pantoate--beta-alanine ligase [Spirochaetota bacterium]MCX8097214.1 pantoate--beta-alanine ligase [Spirochaetota bacterium]MDW8111968.1 pantoate--beta-alanine ligase [Spirochaetia bacterium]
MRVIQKPSEIQREMLNIKKSGKSIGFVPTMGALHEGHLSLVRRSKSENDVTVVSIFVNPKQFGPKEDFNKYPRNFERDKELLDKEGVDYIFHPSVEDMYPEGYETYVDLERLPNHLCGLSRPGHFRGVATVVAKLFNIVQPDRAYFGQKDYQQAKIIKRMVEDLNFPIEIVVMPIVREEDGLAMSSRNTYLSPEERKNASILYKSLQKAKDLILSGEKDVSKIKNEMVKMISSIESRIDYIEIVEPETLEKIDRIPEKGTVVIALAVYIGNARLIDNDIVHI